MAARDPSRGVAVIRRLIRRIGRDSRGIAAVELALVAPLLIGLLCGTVEVTRLVRSHFEAAQMAATVADVIARYETVTDASIQGIFGASSTVMGADDFTSKGRVVLSSVTKAGANDAPVVSWQCLGGGKLAATSSVGRVGGAAQLPADMAIDGGDNVIVAEVFYRYQPIFSLLPIAERTIQKTSVFRPRLGALTTAPGC
jgi:hypothetical protein